MEFNPNSPGARPGKSSLPRLWCSKWGKVRGSMSEVHRVSLRASLYPRSLCLPMLPISSSAVAYEMIELSRECEF